MTETSVSGASSSPEEGAPRVPIVGRLASTVGVAASMSIVLLALALSAEVVLRGVFGTSIRGLYEIAELMIVVIVFLGIAQAEVAENHVRMTLATGRMPGGIRSLVRGIAMVGAGAFLAAMFWALAAKAFDSLESGEFKVGLLNFPVWPSRMIVALGIGLLVSVCLVKGIGHIVHGVRAIIARKENAHVG